MDRVVLALVVALSVAVGFFLGMSLPFLISAVAGGPMGVGNVVWGGDGVLYGPAHHAEDPGLALEAEVRDNVMRACVAQLAERDGLTTLAAGALLESVWQIVEVNVDGAVEIVAAGAMQPEDRTELYATFGRACMQVVEMVYFGGDGASVQWPPPGEPDAPHVDSLDQRGARADVAADGPDGQ